jgi:membrane protein DedA with SNARE-associated domain
MVTETILRCVVEYGYIGIFSVLALGIIGAPIPDEGVLAFAGYLIYEGKLSLVPTMTAAFFGSACGITLSYGLGRAFGNYLIAKLGRAVEITGDRETHIQNWYDRVGKWGLLFGYYLPGGATFDSLRGWDRQTAGAHIRSVRICRSLHLVDHFCLRRILFRQRMDSDLRQGPSHPGG